MRRFKTARHAVAASALLLAGFGCGRQTGPTTEFASRDSLEVAAEVEAALWAFHAADTARDAEAVIGLLWPEYSMFADGQRVRYEAVAASSREFMATLDLIHTVWSDVRIIVLSSNAAVASFLFRDSIVTRTGELIRAQGPTTFVWERRGSEWRLLFADADHYPIMP
jgi:ketosteroid isomerase-like protein